MQKLLTLVVLLLMAIADLQKVEAQEKLDSIFPVRGFCIGAPSSERLDEFIKFINTELVSRKVNTLILRMDYNFQYKSHPELRDPVALSATEVKKLVTACRKGAIRIIPQINLLGHQSWAGQLGNLLKVYPGFDETPHIKLPENYVWPNADGLYCKSYCPLHPEVHKVVFELMDEICDAFETDAFHAGMDEVFYLGHDSCTRCSGRDKAELYAGEVKTIRDHLAQKNRKLWIWGDRLIDGKTTGIGMWEGSYNYTYRAVDMIPRDVTICDWHYERADPTPVYFAMKDLNVITCPWRMPSIAIMQVNDMAGYREKATPQMKENFQGMMQTIWSDAGSFLDEFYGKNNNQGKQEKNSQAECFNAVFKEIMKYAR